MQSFLMTNKFQTAMPQKADETALPVQDNPEYYFRF